jgi:hypothetical protein
MVCKWQVLMAECQSTGDYHSTITHPCRDVSILFFSRAARFCSCWHMSILVPLLHTFICHGDFLLANISPDAETPTVCHVQRAVSPDQLIVIWWMSHVELSLRGIMQFPPPISVELYTIILKCQLTGIVICFNN